MPKGHIKKTASARKSFFTILVIFSGLFVLVLTANFLADDVVYVHTPSNQQLQAERVVAQADLEKGLSDYRSLRSDQAMLFEFQTSSYYGFWMKDMTFPIDIVWLDASKKVVTVREYVLPETYPEAFYPAKPSLYVLETAAGQAAAHAITVGSQLNW